MIPNISTVPRLPGLILFLTLSGSCTSTAQVPKAFVSPSLLAAPVVTLEDEGLDVDFLHASCARIEVHHGASQSTRRPIACPPHLVTALEGRFLRVSTPGGGIFRTTLRAGHGHVAIPHIRRSSRRCGEEGPWQLRVEGMGPVAWQPPPEALEPCKPIIVAHEEPLAMLDTETIPMNSTARHRRLPRRPSPPPPSYNGLRFFAGQFALAGIAGSSEGLSLAGRTGLEAAVVHSLPNTPWAVGGMLRAGIFYSGDSDIPILPFRLGPRADYLLSTKSALYATPALGWMGALNPGASDITLDLTVGLRWRFLNISADLGRAPGLTPQTGVWDQRTHLLIGGTLLLTEEYKKIPWSIVGAEAGTAAAIGVAAGLFVLFVYASGGGPRT